MILRDSELINEVPISCLRGCEKKKRLKYIAWSAFQIYIHESISRGDYIRTKRKVQKGVSLFHIFLIFTLTIYSYL